MSDVKPFDPARHLTLVSGKEYLEVRWRLVWFRSEFPEGRIETQMIAQGDNWAMFKATVTAVRDGAILGSADGHGSEDRQGFGDYIEKAETKAVGRALAALGFGTQFCSDFDFGANTGRVVDAPVQFRSAGNDSQRQPSGGGGYDIAATDRQKNLISSLARDLKLTRQDLDATAQDVVGTTIDNLTRRNASTLIEALKERAGSKIGGSA